MRKVDIGILRSARIKFDFIGDYVLDGKSVPAGNSVFIEDGRLCFNGKGYSALCFKPLTDDCSFVLHDVVIGVGFHWQRFEDQTFKGELCLVVEDGEVRAINRLFVEDYLVSVISSEMSATSSLGSKITADGDCSHEIKRRLLLGRKVMTNLDSILKSRDIE